MLSFIFGAAVGAVVCVLVPGVNTAVAALIAKIKGKVGV
jgi:VIT1/CCC1 family predicted Fe2+/Mn2+ transporter